MLRDRGGEARIKPHLRQPSGIRHPQNSAGGTGAVVIKPSNLKSRKTVKHGRVTSGAKLKRLRLVWD
jgi:hypothetical protein